MSIRVELVDRPGGAVTARRSFDQGPVTCGRSAACDVQFGAEDVSRKQFVFEELNGCWYVRHLGRLSPTFLNDASLVPSKPVRVSTGDVVAVDRFQFRVVIDEDPGWLDRSVSTDALEHMGTVALDRLSGRTAGHLDGSRGETPALVLLKDGWPTRTFRLTRDGKRYVIGRSRKTDFQVGEMSVSRKHLQVWCTEEGRPFARDMGARYPVKVNEIAVLDEIELSHGDMLSVGRAVLRFEWLPEHADVSREPPTGAVEPPTTATIVKDRGPRTRPLGGVVPAAEPKPDPEPPADEPPAPEPENEDVAPADEPDWDAMDPELTIARELPIPVEEPREEPEPEPDSAHEEPDDPEPAEADWSEDDLDLTIAREEPVPVEEPEEVVPPGPEPESEPEESDSEPAAAWDAPSAGEPEPELESDPEPEPEEPEEPETPSTAPEATVSETVDPSPMVAPSEPAAVQEPEPEPEPDPEPEAPPPAPPPSEEEPTVAFRDTATALERLMAMRNDGPKAPPPARVPPPAAEPEPEPPPPPPEPEAAPPTEDDPNTWSAWDAPEDGEEEIDDEERERRLTLTGALEAAGHASALAELREGRPQTPDVPPPPPDSDPEPDTSRAVVVAGELPDRMPHEAWPVRADDGEPDLQAVADYVTRRPPPAVTRRSSVARWGPWQILFLTVGAILAGLAVFLWII